MNIQVKHLALQVYIQDYQTQHIYLHLWQKALEFNLKGMIHVQQQIITVELEGAKHTIVEFIRIVTAFPSANLISMTVDKPLNHYATLTTNVW